MAFCDIRSVFVGLLLAKLSFSDTGNNAMSNNLNHLSESDIVFKKPIQTIKISTSTQCINDFERFCGRGNKDSNFAVLDCLQDDERTNNGVSAACQHFLWQFKMALTKDDRFESVSSSVCKQELLKVPECAVLQPGHGLIIPCLIEHSESVASVSCRSFLKRMATIVFSDYRLMYKFGERCQQDIVRFKCGRLATSLDDNEEFWAHSQGQTLECLARLVDKLTDTCRRQVILVSKLQADDFHLDRPLYYACSDDSENLCGSVNPGKGAIFECLADHLGTLDLTEKCREMVEVRQRLVAQDVRVDRHFFSHCRWDIEEYQCMANGDDDAGRAHILLCLENAHMNEKRLSPECVQEMLKTRQRLVDDYKINPSLISRCSVEIEAQCDGLEPGGKTLHCLLSMARDRRRHSMRDECMAELSAFLKEVNVVEDIRLDKPLQVACSTVVSAVCSHVRPGNSRIIDCLMDNMDEDEMTDECEDKLLEIQFFVVRDFRLDPDLFKSCRKDAMALCHEKGDWLDDSTNPDQGPLVLSCLYRNMLTVRGAVTEGLSRVCAFAVQRVMRQRSLDVDLHPEIERACLADLGNLCSEDQEDVKRGEEIKCLQSFYDTLASECRKAISEFTAVEMDYPNVDAILVKACTPMMRKFCKDYMDQRAADAGAVLECLIQHKNHDEMLPKCAAGIEHHQLISMKEFRFNHKFRDACQRSVDHLCRDKVKSVTKADVIACLSSHVRNDTILDREHTVAAACRHQLKVELLQRQESIHLDQELNDRCSDDIHQFCENTAPGNAQVLECLKRHQYDLSSGCQKLLFKRQMEEFAVADYALWHNCKRMIRKYCDLSMSEPEIFKCLTMALNSDFDYNCRRIVQQRQVSRARDFRLNPILQKACHHDIPKFCMSILKTVLEDVRLEGKIINCLLKQYPHKALSSNCEDEITPIIRFANMDINKSPVLLEACQDEVKEHCSDKVDAWPKRLRPDEGVAIMKVMESYPGSVVECLKENLMRMKSKDCQGEVASMLLENRMDISVDPVLLAACQSDMIDLCHTAKPHMFSDISCLLSHVDKADSSMTRKCRVVLNARSRMWREAEQVAEVETLDDVYRSIVNSPAKNYFFTVLFTVLGVIFIVGLSCGRFSKRLRAEVKNR